MANMKLEDEVADDIASDRVHKAARGAKSIMSQSAALDKVPIKRGIAMGSPQGVIPTTFRGVRQMAQETAIGAVASKAKDSIISKIKAYRGK